ncbi:MAG: FIST C-terminal domain-containing protein [Balneola sp.]
MKTEQLVYEKGKGWLKQYSTEEFPAKDTQLVLTFGPKKLLSDKKLLNVIKDNYPKADIVMSSTGGEIHNVSVNLNTIVATAIYLEKTSCVPIQFNLSDYSSSDELGAGITKKLDSEELKHILIFSDGYKINGSKLVAGINRGLNPKVVVTGGFAGDDKDYMETYVGLNEIDKTGNAVAIGFYGRSLKIGFGSEGGWDEFGPKREVTLSKGNVLYELDGKNALDLYKLYLGPKAEHLPNTALLFPLSIKLNENSFPIVRTVLSIDEKDKSITFAEDLPEGTIVRLMKASYNTLIEGASNAARNSILKIASPELVLVKSCVGRKLVLGPRTEEEIEAIVDIIGDGACYTGFYSHGEIAPSQVGYNCDLYNQSLTLTTYLEI